MTLITNKTLAELKRLAKKYRCHHGKQPWFDILGHLVVGESDDPHTAETVLYNLLEESEEGEKTIAAIDALEKISTSIPALLARLESAEAALPHGCVCDFGDDPRMTGHSTYCAKARAHFEKVEGK